MKKLLSFFTSIVILFLVSSSAYASEGTYELRSTDSNKYKCFAASLQMQNLSYKVIFSCRNIVFPVDETIYSYILWTNPQDGSKAVKLGSIGLGRGEFLTKVGFSSLFITAEQNPGVKEPTGKVVMKGSIKPITFLEKDVVSETKTTDKDTDTSEDETTPTPEAQQSSVRDRLLTGLKRAGLASGLALVAILGLVFVLTRPR